MGETVSSLAPAFNSSVKVACCDERTSSDAGALALREGNAAPSAEAAQWTPSLVASLHTHASDSVRVVQERPDEALRLYQRRGKAEAHMGELKSVLDPHLGSTDRGCSTMQQVDARNEVQLLISLFAYELMHVLRDLMQQRTGEGWSLARLREQVLKVAALTQHHARRLRIQLGVAGRRWWPVLMAGLAELAPAR